MITSPLSRRCFLAALASAPWRGSERSEPFIRGLKGTGRGRVANLLTDFQTRFRIPGLSLAMADRGQLKLLACTGVADRVTGEPIRPQHQFRIASVSKPMTAVAVLRLVEQRRLTLDDSVFGKGGVLADFMPAAPVAERGKLERITVRDLLQHTAGGWSNQRRDPMFVPEARGLSHADLIRWTLRHQPLARNPGTGYAYSNFGYCLLGRIIERVRAQPYEQAMHELVLKPCGATATELAGNTRAARRPDEVTYYEDDRDPYGPAMDVRRMDAHGGWISTASDLVRFANHVDGFPRPADLLSKRSLRTMTTPSPHGDGYALGWATNRHNNWWHTGSFAGGSSILVRTADGHCWAVLVNSRARVAGYTQAVDELPWKIRRSIDRWGNHDLFQ